MTNVINDSKSSVLSEQFTTALNKGFKSGEDENKFHDALALIDLIAIHNDEKMTLITNLHEKRHWLKRAFIPLIFTFIPMSLFVVIVNSYVYFEHDKVHPLGFILSIALLGALGSFIWTFGEGYYVYRKKIKPQAEDAEKLYTLLCTKTASNQTLGVVIAYQIMNLSEKILSEKKVTKYDGCKIRLSITSEETIKKGVFNLRCLLSSTNIDHNLIFDSRRECNLEEKIDIAYSVVEAYACIDAAQGKSNRLYKTDRDLVNESLSKELNRFHTAYRQRTN